MATSAAEFAQKALRLVDDDALRVRVRDEIATRRPRLFDDPAPVRALEEALASAVAQARAKA